MTDRDLEKLKGLPIPAPSANAKEAAINAALAVFDDANGRENVEESLTPSQGSAEIIRLTEVNQPRRIRFMPNFQTSTKIAASIVALTVAAPAAFYVTHNTGPHRQTLSGNIAPSSTAPSLQQPQQMAEATPPPAKPSHPEPSTCCDVTSVEERLAELEATTARKGNRQTSIVVESKDGALRIGSQSSAADNVVVLPDGPARAPAAVAAASPPPLVTTEAKRKSSVPVYPGDRARVADGIGRMAQAHQGSAGVTAYFRKNEPERRTLQLEPERYYQPQPENRDKFDGAPDNPVKQVASEPISTFSIDVDTASYSFARRSLNAGHLPPKDSVRVEEMINYFPYAYPRPESAEVPFQPTVTVLPSPWHTGNMLVHIGIKGYDLNASERPHANLVLLIDVSGSMAPDDRLPLLKNAFRMLLDELKPEDTVSIVTYASDTRIALEPTKVAEKGRIVSVVDSLQAGGGTYGEGGIQKAYQLAEASFDPKGVNRIVLATDGDFNIGITDQSELKGFIERKREKGIFLSVLGVGNGNYNDAMMQALAQNGNGTAAYVDTLSEARKVLVDEASSTLFTIAKDVKIQLEFNPARVSEYRLVGYETRALKREDFNNDRVDAGDIGSGHTVTAIYEVTPVGAKALADPLRYGKPTPQPTAEQPPTVDPKSEFGFLKLRYKLPKEDVSKLASLAIGPSLEAKSLEAAPADVRFAVAVASFGQILRGALFTQGFSYDDVIAMAQSAKGDDPFGYRAEFLNLVRLAKSARP